MSIGYVYCLQEREFINNREPVFKIGKTGKRDFSRFKQYPKGSELLYYVKVYEYHKVESMIIQKFKNKFKQRRDLGYEYFEIDFSSIESEINSIVCNYTDDNMKYESQKDFLEYKRSLVHAATACEKRSLLAPKNIYISNIDNSEENYENFGEFRKKYRVLINQMNQYFCIPEYEICNHASLWIGSHKKRYENHNIAMYLFHSHQELVNRCEEKVAFLQAFMIECGAENKFNFKIGENNQFTNKEWNKVSEATKKKYELMFKPTEKMIQSKHNPIIKMMNDLFGSSVCRDWSKKKDKENSIMLFIEKKTNINKKSVRIKQCVNADFVMNHINIIKYRYEKKITQGKLNIKFGEESENFINY